MRLSWTSAIFSNSLWCAVSRCEKHLVQSVSTFESYGCGFRMQARHPCVMLSSAGQLIRLLLEQVLCTDVTKVLDPGSLLPEKPTFQMIDQCVLISHNEMLPRATFHTLSFSFVHDLAHQGLYCKSGDPQGHSPGVFVCPALRLLQHQQEQVSLSGLRHLPWSLRLFHLCQCLIVCRAPAIPPRLKRLVNGSCDARDTGVASVIGWKCREGGRGGDG